MVIIIMKSKVALFFVFTVIFSLFLTACGAREEKDVNINNTEHTTESQGTEAQTTEYTADAETFDWGRKEFKVLVNLNDGTEWRDVDFTAEEEMGETINDAVYRKNLKIEEMFNIAIVPVHSNTHLADVKKSVKADDNAYDILFNTPFDNSALSQEGYLYDLKTINEIDLTKPWWDQNAVKDLSIAHKLYMVTGDIGTMYRKSVGIILFNKDMVKEYALDNPYNLVESKKWTQDKFLEMCKAVSEDLDANQKYDDQDKYGLVGYRDIIAISLIGAGVDIATKNEDDIPELTFYSDKTVQIYTKVTELLFQDQYFWSWSKAKKDNERSRVMFANNQALFNWNEFHSIPNLRAMEKDFGILPMPLFDENQERYYHIVNPHVAMTLAIPISNHELEKTGALVDNLAAVSKNILTPAYYDISLRNKYARDDESIMTMDLIFGSMKYDPGYMYNWANVGTFTLDMLDAKQTDIASKYEKISVAAQKALDNMIEKYESLQ